LKLQIPKRRHYELIGKGGSTVKQLQQSYNVKIDIPGRDEQSNEITITGNPDNFPKLQSEIESILGIKISKDPLTIMYLDIPLQHHGALIGKGGSNLHELERKFGISVNIPRKDDVNTFVVVEGAEKDLIAAVEDIEASLKIKVSTSKKPPALGPPNTKSTSSATTTSSSSSSSSAQHGSVEAASYREKKGQLVIDDKTPLNKVIFFPDKDPIHHHNFETFLSYLNSATQSMDVCVFTITDDRISNTLMYFHKKGGNVRVITDNDTSVAIGSDIQKFRECGIPVKMDTSPYHMHHKFAVIDKKLLINGSFNWTHSAATTNCENVMITNNKEFVSEFDRQFETMWNDTVNFQ